MQYLTGKQLAETLQVSIYTVKRWVTLGMPRIKFENTSRFELEEVIAWMKSREEIKSNNG